jgi:hypothetical protein
VHVRTVTAHVKTFTRAKEDEARARQTVLRGAPFLHLSDSLLSHLPLILGSPSSPFLLSYSMPTTLPSSSVVGSLTPLPIHHLFHFHYCLSTAVHIPAAVTPSALLSIHHFAYFLSRHFPPPVV